MKNDILFNFVDKLAERAEQFEGTEMDYLKGYLLSTLKSLDLYTSDLKILKKQTESLEGSIKEQNTSSSILLDVSK